MHEVLVNRLGGLSLPRKSVVRLTDRPDMTLEFTVNVKQQCNNNNKKARVYNFANTVDPVCKDGIGFLTFFGVKLNVLL